MAREGANRHISIPKSFSEGNTREWFQHFEICCRADGWNDETKALKLPTLLELRRNLGRLDRGVDGTV